MIYANQSILSDETICSPTIPALKVGRTPLRREKLPRLSEDLSDIWGRRNLTVGVTFLW